MAWSYSFFCLIVGTFAAIYIGYTQNQINKNIFETPYIVAIETTYGNKSINVANKGQANVWLWGTQIGDAEQLIYPYAQIIAPQSSFYIPIGSLIVDESKLKKEILQSPSKQGVIPITLFVKSQIHKKFRLKVLLYITVENNGGWHRCYRTFMLALWT
jgi:hypothetical protein